MIDGPAYCSAARPVTVKMPAPMMTPTPKTVRSSAESRFLSWYSGSSVSLIDCSTDLVRIRLTAGHLPGNGCVAPRGRPGPAEASADGGLAPIAPSAPAVVPARRPAVADGAGVGVAVTPASGGRSGLR